MTAARPLVRRRWTTSLAGLAALAAAPWLFAVGDGVRLNQFEIARHQASHGVVAPSRLAQTWLVSGWWRGLGRIEAMLDPPAGDPTTPAGALALVLAVVPRCAWIYPGGGYYYLELPTVAGSMRATLGLRDAGDGVLHLHWRLGEGAAAIARRATLGGGDGIVTVKQRGDAVELHHRGGVHRFVWPELPPARVALDDHERHVATFDDESGLRFALAFDAAERRFRYLLDDARGAAEDFDEVAPGLLVGRRTGFAFIDEERPARRVLVAVARAAVLANGPHDGPFDQVPPRLALRPLLHLAYPHTARERSVDEHGRVLRASGLGVAVSPYLIVGGRAELVATWRLCAAVADGGRALRACLTDEPQNHG